MMREKERGGEKIWRERLQLERDEREREMREREREMRERERTGGQQPPFSHAQGAGSPLARHGRRPPAERRRGASAGWPPATPGER